MTKTKPKLKKFTLRIPAEEWDKFRKVTNQTLGSNPYGPTPYPTDNWIASHAISEFTKTLIAARKKMLKV